MNKLNYNQRERGQPKHQKLKNPSRPHNTELSNRRVCGSVGMRARAVMTDDESSKHVLCKWDAKTDIVMLETEAGDSTDR